LTTIFSIHFYPRRVLSRSRLSHENSVITRNRDLGFRLYSRFPETKIQFSSKFFRFSGSSLNRSDFATNGFNRSLNSGLRQQPTLASGSTWFLRFSERLTSDGPHHLPRDPLKLPPRVPGITIRLRIIRVKYSTGKTLRIGD